MSYKTWEIGWEGDLPGSPEHSCEYRDGTFVGVRADGALIRVCGREIFGCPVGAGVHTFDGPAERDRRKRLEVA